MLNHTPSLFNSHLAKSKLHTAKSTKYAETFGWIRSRDPFGWIRCRDTFGWIRCRDPFGWIQCRDPFGWIRCRVTTGRTFYRGGPMDFGICHLKYTNKIYHFPPPLSVSAPSFLPTSQKVPEDKEQQKHCRTDNPLNVVSWPYPKAESLTDFKNTFSISKMEVSKDLSEPWLGSGKCHTFLL